MTYTIKGLDAAVEGDPRFEARWCNNWHQFYYAIKSDNPDGAGVDLPGIGRAVYVDEYGGEEQGYDYYYIFTVTDAAGEVRTFKRDGWYASHDGGYYDGPTYEAKPVQRVVTDWVEA